MRPILNLDDLTAWLETRPRFETYDYTKSTDCLLTRYMREKGLPVHSTCFTDWLDTSGRFHSTPEMLPLTQNVALGLAPVLTMGGALHRARKLKYGRREAWRLRLRDLWRQAVLNVAAKQYGERV